MKTIDMIEKKYLETIIMSYKDEKYLNLYKTESAEYLTLRAALSSILMERKAATELDQQLDLLYFDFFREHIDNKFDVSRAYCDYIDLYLDGELAEYFSEEGTVFNVDRIFKLIKKKDVFLMVWNTRNKYLTDLTIKKIGVLSRAFFSNYSNSTSTEELIVFHGELYTMLCSYINEQLKYQKSIEDAEISKMTLEELGENLIFVYANLLFNLNHYGIRRAFDSFELQFNHTELLKEIKGTTYKEIKAALKMMIDKYETHWESMDILKQLEITANQLHENMYNRLIPSMNLLANEGKEQMLEVLIDFIQQEYPNGDINKIVTAFGAFSYLYHNVKVTNLGFENFCRDGINLQRTIYDCLHRNSTDDSFTAKFVKYLDCIWNQQWDQALALCSEFEYPHFHKVYDMMIWLDENQNLPSVSNQEILEVQSHIDALKELKDVITGKRSVRALPRPKGDIFEYFYDIAGNESLNPMIRLYSTFMNALTPVVQNIRQLKEIEKLNASLEEAKKSLEMSIESKNKIINKHAHTWKHIVYPKTVKEVAQELYNRGDIEYANKLFKAYNSENILQHDLKLLELNYASSPEEMKRIFRSDILLLDAKSGVGIREVFLEALDIVLFRILMESIDTRHELEVVKSSLSAFENINELRNSYTTHFVTLEKPTVSVVDWFCKYIYPLNMSISSEWESIRFKRDGVAYAQLIEIFIDLIHNSLNYGVKSKCGFINIVFGMETIGEYTLYYCEMRNPTDKSSPFTEGTGQGLKSVIEVLTKLNHIGEIPVMETSTDQQHNFKVVLRFEENLIVKRRV